ncbi:MAG TPA: hypothetical protein PLE50_00970 [Rhabdaerophilum sp.]|nr:hypothetical protein [Rhabdaerophilum sp.]
MQDAGLATDAERGLIDATQPRAFDQFGDQGLALRDRIGIAGLGDNLSGCLVDQSREVERRAAVEGSQALFDQRRISLVLKKGSQGIVAGDIGEKVFGFEIKILGKLMFFSRQFKLLLARGGALRDERHRCHDAEHQKENRNNGE